MSIYDVFRSKGYTKERATEAAAMYGCTPERPKHFGVNVTGVSYRGLYDGVYHWRCDSCGVLHERFTDEQKEQLGIHAIPE